MQARRRSSRLWCRRRMEPRKGVVAVLRRLSRKSRVRRRVMRGRRRRRVMGLRKRLLMRGRRRRRLSKKMHSRNEDTQNLVSKRRRKFRRS